MYASTQRDGGPAEHRWRPLFNAHYYMPCSNTTKSRNQVKFGGVPQSNENISAASGPKFIILWGHLEDILLLNMFFFRLSIYGAQMEIFGNFFASCIFSEPRAAYFRTAF